MSMPTLQLISHDLCPYVQRAVVTLLEKPHDRTIDLSTNPNGLSNFSPGKSTTLKG